MNVECVDCGVTMRMVDSTVDPTGRELIAHLTCPACGAREQFIARLNHLGVDQALRVAHARFDPQQARERAAAAL